MKRFPVGEAGAIRPGASFHTPDGQLMFHACHNPECPGIVFGIRSNKPDAAAAIHYTPAEALEIATALGELARTGLG